jgi:dihydrofolate reductase
VNHAHQLFETTYLSVSQWTAAARTGSPPLSCHPTSTTSNVDDIGRAIMVARELAGERNVAVTAGNVGGQALALGLIDEVAMDVLPVIFGRGKRYFGTLDAQQLLEDSDVLIQGRRVLHVRYRVRR